MKYFNLLILSLILSATTAKAQNNVRITSYFDNKDKRSYYLAWDIKTGESVQYSWNGTTFKYEAFAINIPAQPVPGATGNIMFDVYFDSKDNKSYYIAWDTKTGKSVQYTWNNAERKYEAFDINLPEKPLANVTGEVMIKAYYDVTDGKGYYMVYDTNGGKSLQYRWNGTDYKWVAFEINLPEKPLDVK